MTEWLIIAFVAGLLYKFSKLRVIHLEFGEHDEPKPGIKTVKKKQLRK
jgi:hypothetical protein